MLCSVLFIVCGNTENLAWRAVTEALETSLAQPTGHMTRPDPGLGWP